ncbi:putative membrane protein [Hydrogenoanaerobacterium saccharovorans]|uniref:Uncharacterized membrane protein n=1 Tax=Hydrogenoanaerobacterium saccharovorans TaxID=474960 RepID=A0A1H7YPP1_9FIRM|nr:hypothetical protein [Hydrogenoanaerobacterium saccharovorans]RPF49083.1 putative membrane protein [Hydrogenoanaerobacterium saccharovorans]SEM48222.1 Uncharacterized membrane protein [Hydrogenoanaerobacterium saccharovorans]
MFYFCKLILYFSFYSFLGWVCECIYCSVIQKKLVNRGFLTGPVCPVYGFGALLVIFLLRPFTQNAFLVFFCGMLVTSVLEYFTALLLERLFHMKWWDYSQFRFHIHGRVCLLNSVLFGLLSAVVVLVIHPSAAYVAERLSVTAIYVLGGILVVLFMADTLLSVRTTLEISGKLEQLYAAAEELRERSESYKQQFQQNIESKFENKLQKLRSAADLEEYRTEFEEKRAAAAEHIEKLKARIAMLIRSNKLHRRLINAFPHLKSLRYQNTFEKFREAIKEKRWNTRK